MEGRNLRERGDGAEVVVDVEHGGVQQGVDILETLQPGLQAPPPFSLQLPQLLLRQARERRRRRRHGRHWGSIERETSCTSTKPDDFIFIFITQTSVSRCGSLPKGGGIGSHGAAGKGGGGKEKGNPGIADPGAAAAAAAAADDVAASAAAEVGWLVPKGNRRVTN